MALLEFTGTSGAGLQALINSAAAGDTIAIPEGAPIVHGTTGHLRMDNYHRAAPGILIVIHPRRQVGFYWNGVNAATRGSGVSIVGGWLGHSSLNHYAIRPDFMDRFQVRHATLGVTQNECTLGFRGCQDFLAYKLKRSPGRGDTFKIYEGGNRGRISACYMDSTGALPNRCFTPGLAWHRRHVPRTGFSCVASGTTWSSTTTYAAGDVVNYPTSADRMVSLQDGNLNRLPTDHPDWWEHRQRDGSHPDGLQIHGTGLFANIMVDDNDVRGFIQGLGFWGLTGTIEDVWLYRNRVLTALFANAINLSANNVTPGKKLVCAENMVGSLYRRVGQPSNTMNYRVDGTAENVAANVVRWGNLFYPGTTFGYGGGTVPINEAAIWAAAKPATPPPLPVPPNVPPMSTFEWPSWAPDEWRGEPREITV